MAIKIFDKIKTIDLSKTFETVLEVKASLSRVFDKKEDVEELGLDTSIEEQNKVAEKTRKLIEKKNGCKKGVWK